MFYCLELLGYNLQNNDNNDCPVTPCSNPKRQKHSSAGTDEDWLYLINSTHSSKLNKCINYSLHLKCNPNESHNNVNNTLRINVSSVLFPFIRLIHYCFHLLYEDLKLNILRSDDLQMFANFLKKIASDLGLVEYVIHYWKDFPDGFTPKCIGIIGSNEQNYVNEYSFIGEKPVNIMEFIYNYIKKGNEVGPYPFVNNINNRSKDIIQVRQILIWVNT